MRRMATHCARRCLTATSSSAGSRQNRPLLTVLSAGPFLLPDLVCRGFRPWQGCAGHSAASGTRLLAVAAEAACCSAVATAPAVAAPPCTEASRQLASRQCSTMAYAPCPRNATCQHINTSYSIFALQTSQTDGSAGHLWRNIYAAAAAVYLLYVSARYQRQM